MLPIFTKPHLALCQIGIFLSGIYSCPLIASPAFPAQSSGSSTAPSSLTGLETIENGLIKVGVNGRYGGAIAYLSTAGGTNMVNNYDLGRQFQIALYGGPNDYSKNGFPAWAGLGWNPIQAGDTYGNVSEVVAFDKQPNQLYVKTIGKQFALNNVPGEATTEHWISLSGNVVKVHARIELSRSDRTQYQARTQEFPCMYVNGTYNNIYTYQGNNPYSNASLTKLTPPTPMEYLRPVTEPWMAAVDKNGFGVGLFAPYNYQWTKAFFGDDLTGGEFSSSSAYVANTRFELLDHNIVHEWDYELVVGNINDIRNYVYKQPRLPSTINYTFNNSRKGWYYNNATDTGWPIRNQLHVIISDKDQGQAKSPAGFWRGRDNKTLYLRAAFQGLTDKFRINWRQLNDQEFYGFADRNLDFSILDDGQFHTYAIDLSQKVGWIDQDIIQIQLRPRAEGPNVKGWMKIEYISTVRGGELIVSIPTTPVTPPTTTPVTPPVASSATTPPVITVPPTTTVTTPPTTTVTTPPTTTVTTPPTTTVTTPPTTTVTTPPTTTVTVPSTTTVTSPPIPPITSSTGVALKLIAPTYDCNTGGLTFRSTGGNGSTIEYMAIGVTSWTTNPDQRIDIGVRQDPRSQPIVLMVRQNGVVVSLPFDFRAGCPNIPVSETNPLQLTAPIYDCMTGGLTFQSTGGNGTTVEYKAAGVTDWTPKINQRIDIGVIQDPTSKPLTLMARQNGATVSYMFDFRATCPGVTPPIPTLIPVTTPVLPPTVKGPIVKGEVKEIAQPKDKAVDANCLCPVLTIKRVRKP